MSLTFRQLRLDRTTASVLAYRCWQVLQGTVTVALVLDRLSPNEQGFYYTFQSIPALQVLSELGLTFVLTQFASHEFAQLHFFADLLEGDNRAKARLGSLLRSSVAWFVRAALVTILVAFAAGYLLFTRHAAAATGVHWQLSFFLLVVTNAALLAMAPFFAILDGVGLLHETSRVRLLMDVVAGLALWVTLTLGGGLHALWVYAAVRLCVAAWWLSSRRRRIFLDLARFRSGNVEIDWRAEVWPFHWRMAVSSVSGFFIAQTLNPIIFSMMGPTAAGQFGLTLSLTAAILTVAMSFVYARSPGFGALVAAGKDEELRHVWLAALRRSAAIAALGFGALLAGSITLARLAPQVSVRLLPLSCLGLMCGAQFAILSGSAAALYMRAHKTEPMLVVSVCMAIAIPSTGYLAARAGSLFWLTTAYAVTVAILMGMVPWWILARFRRRLAERPSFLLRGNY